MTLLPATQPFTKVRDRKISENGALSFHVLRGEAWERSERSEMLPSLDPALIADGTTADTQCDAVRKLRTAMRAR